MLLPSLSRRERLLLCVFAALVLVAVVGQATPLARLGTVSFVDLQSGRGVPNAMDVLTALPSLALGLWGLRWLHWMEHAHEEVQNTSPLPLTTKQPPVNALDCAWIFFAGLVLNAAGAAMYHLEPDSLRVAADRAGMAVAFAGLIGVAACERVSARAGWPAAWFTMAGGLAAVAVQHETGNAMPWALFEFGGVGLVCLWWLAKPIEGSIGLKLGWIAVWCLLAKILELSDSAIYEATRHMLSGHSLKHLTAALAALPVLHALQSMAPQDATAQSWRGRPDGLRSPKGRFE